MVVTVSDDLHVCQLLSQNTVISAFLVKVLEMLSCFLVSCIFFTDTGDILYRMSSCVNRGREAKVVCPRGSTSNSSLDSALCPALGFTS